MKNYLTKTIAIAIGLYAILVNIKLATGWPSGLKIDEAVAILVAGLAILVAIDKIDLK